MKAAVLYGDEDIRYETIDCPAVDENSVKVRVRSAGICGSDVPRVLSGGAHFYPIVLGHEFSGDVVEIGENVKTVSIGERVSGVPLLPCFACNDCQKGNYSLCKHYSFIGSRKQGAFAQYIVLPARNVVAFDKTVSYTQGALFEPASVALHGILHNNFQGGKNVAVVGCGTIGLFAVQLTKIFGAKSVTALDIEDDKLALAKKLGANNTLNTLSKGFDENLDSITNGQGFDYVFETAGSAKTISLCFSLAGNKAHVCFVGTPTSDVTFSPSSWEQMNRKEFYLTGSWMSYSAPFPGKEWELTAHYFKTGQLRVDDDMIFKSYPMERAKEAFLLFKTPSKVKGKILLTNEYIAL